jgi:pimeloyl-ACP methyl ester carboxylesterase
MGHSCFAICLPQLPSSAVYDTFPHHLLCLPAANMTAPKQVEDFLAFTRHIRAAYGRQLSSCPLFAAGYSIGAQYAALAAVKAPQLFAGVAMVSPAAVIQMDIVSR